MYFVHEAPSSGLKKSVNVIMGETQKFEFVFAALPRIYLINIGTLCLCIDTVSGPIIGVYCLLYVGQTAPI